MTESLWKGFRRVAYVCAILLPTTVAAQGAGTVSGTVTDAVTGQPLAGVQIQIVGGQIGGLSNARGAYLLQGVPAGTQTIRATYIGYRSEDQSVEVQAGGSAVVNLTMTQAAINLDEIIVTGTAGRTEKRSLGNSVSKVDAEEVTDATPVQTVTEMLGARTPGVTLTSMSGQVGTAARVRIRGAGSLNAGLDPVYYVDGVRINSNVNDGFSTSNGVVQGTNPLDAINPNDVQSIEVIKGPAAATLYGAEAAGGVIQIITKRGSSGGGVQWTAQVEAGQNEWAAEMPTNYTLCTVRADSTALGMSTSQFNSYFGNRIGSSAWPGCDQFTGSEPLSQRLLTDQPVRRDPQALRVGDLTRYNVSARGGGENYNFFLSGERADEQGVYYNNYSNRTGGRANFGFVPNEKLNFNVATSYTRLDVQEPIANNGSNGILRNGFRGRPGHSSSWGDAGIGWHGFIPEVSNQYDNRTYTERTILSLTATYTPMSWLTNRLTVGMDKIDRTNQVFYRQDTTSVAPWGDDEASGAVYRYLPNSHYWTVDYQATATNDLTPNLGSAFSAGLQLMSRQNEWAEVDGWGLITDKLNIVGAAANVTADQGYSAQTSLGFYGQEQLSWKDRVYGTLALRVDDNSAFGSDFSMVVYPKASLAWVISDESFFPFDFVDQLKLRAAFGMAGNAPGPGQADRTFGPSQTSVGDVVVNRVFGTEYGNPNLKAETGQELELGFDASVLNGRLGVEFTYYDQHTMDALVSVPDPPSSGFSGSHMENIGEIANSGIELAINGSPIYTKNVQLDGTLTFSTNRNKLISFGTSSIQEISFGSFATVQKHIEDYPLGGFWSLDVERDADGNPVLRDGAGNIVTDPKLGHVTVLPDSAMEYLGPSLPTREIGLATTLTLFQNFRLYAHLDYKGGNYQWCAICSIRSRSNRNTEELNNPDTDPVERLVLYSLATRPYLKPADFLKLRELSATADLPAAWAQKFGASAVSLTVAGHNLWMWTRYFEGFDPEVVFYSRSNFDAADYASTPTVRRVTASLRFVF